MKKKLAVFLCAAMALGLTACSAEQTAQTNDASQTEMTGAESTEQSAAEGGTSEAPVELEVAFWGDKAEIEMKSALLEQYEEEHPNVTIKQTYTDGGTYQA